MKGKVRNFLKGLATVTLVVAVAFGTGETVKAADVEIAGGKDLDSAVKINCNTSYVGSFDVKGEEDWYKFTPQSGDGYYELKVDNFNIAVGGNGSYGFNHEIKSKNDEQFAVIEMNDDYTSIISRFKITDKTQDYYIHFYMGYNCLKEGWGDGYPCTGNYRVTLTYIPDDAGDTMAGAKVIANRNTLTGKLESYYDFDSSKTQENSMKWAVPYHVGDKDYYTFTAPKNGNYIFTLKNLNIETPGGNGTFALHGSLVTKYEEQLGTSIEAYKGEEKTLTVKLNAGETYYFSVYNGTNNYYKTGDYRITVQDEDYVTALSAPKKFKAKKQKGKIALSWKKSAKVSQYEIYRAKGKGKFKKIATVKKAKYVDKKVSKKLKYKYRIKAVKMTDGTNIKAISTYATLKNVRCK